MTDKFIDITWYVSDVMGEVPRLTPEQAEHVLLTAKQRHDCNIGINWDVLHAVADSLYPA